MKTKVFPLLVLSLCWLAGCGDSPWNSPYPAKDAGKNIYYASFTERPKHLDPTSSYSEDEAVFLGQIYEPPLQYHFLKRPYTLIPLSATEVPHPAYYDSQGRRLPADAPDSEVARAVYTIHIKHGRHYQPHPSLARDDQGHYRYHHLSPADIAHIHSIKDFPETGTRELVAEDFVYQIKRLVKPGLHSPLGSFISRYILGLKELGERLRKDQAAGKPVDLRNYDFPGAKAVGRYTYQITLQEKYPQFVYWLATYFFSPVPWEADAFYDQPGMKENNISLDWYPVGTGPFMLTENNPNRHMILKRNPDFGGELYPSEGNPGDREAGYLDDAGKPLPFLDEAYYSLEKEAIPAWSKFLQGYLDVSTVLADSFDQAIQFNANGEPGLTEAMKKKGIGLLNAVRPSIWYLGFNMLDDVVGGDSQRARLLRRAISIAVDYEEFISIFTNGRGIPAQSPIPPGVVGYRSGRAGMNPYVYDWVDGKPVRKPLSAAVALMKQAGYVDGRDVKTGKPLILYLDVTAAANSKTVLNWYRKQFDKLGIQLVIRATDYNRFQQKMREGTAQMLTWGWNADYPDAENFLFLLYGENAKVGHDGENAANYSNPDYDRLFVKMRGMEPGPERQAVINQMVSIAQRDAPWAWGYYPVAYTLYHNWYGNAKPNLMARNNLKYRKVDSVLRQKERVAWNQPVTWPVILILGLLGVSVVPAVLTYRRRQRASIS